MLYLAQVQKQVDSEQMELQLLAHESNQNLWELDHGKNLLIEAVHDEQKSLLKEGLLLLVELNDQQKVVSLKNPKNWIIDVIKKYLTGPEVNEDFVKIEQEKVEKWRQEMALQSQGLTRRSLELELRQEELKELEEKLKQQQKEIAEFKKKE